MSLFFPETTGSDLSNGVSLMTVYALLKKLLGAQAWTMGVVKNDEISENPDFSKNLDSGRIWTPRGGFRAPDAHPTPAQLASDS